MKRLRRLEQTHAPPHDRPGPLVTLLPIVAAEAQTPPDINPVTLSRLPPITPSDLDAEGQKLLAARANVNPASGSGHVTIYGLKVAEGFGAIVSGCCHH
jgi:hypothetical protein